MTSVKQSGFTIVELLIVIVVIGILAAIVLNVFSGTQQKATASILKSDLLNASKKMEVAHINSGSYPTEFPQEVNVSSGIGLALTQTSDTSTYCINGSAVRYDSVVWYHSRGKSVEAGLCPGPVHTGSRSMIGEFKIASSPTPSPAPDCQPKGSLCVPNNVINHINSNWPTYTYERAVSTSGGYEIRLVKGENEVRLEYNKSWSLTNTEIRD